MIYVGIDVAKNKHDCFIFDSDGVIHKDGFTIRNSLEGFNKLLQPLKQFPLEDVKIGLEATGHYSNNIINFLERSGYDLVVFNPLKTNLFRKAQSLRKTKTDKIDARIIAEMLTMSNPESYSPQSYHIDELKSLSRHRSRLVKQCSTLKISLTRLIDIIFPELSSYLPSLHNKSIYTLLLEFPTPIAIANAHLTRLTNVLRSHHSASTKEKSVAIRNLARQSIGSFTNATVFELHQIIPLIQDVKAKIDALNSEIKKIMDKVDSPITTIPGISYTLGSIILSEIGQISRFNTPAQLLAFAGLEPSTHQSGTFTASSAHMVKRGSPYLRHALITAARLVALYDPTFKRYLEKKRAEGKHYKVALSHVARKLVRVIFHLLKHNTTFVPQSD